MEPTSINIDKTQRMMTIDWSDGHISFFEFGLLRAACPCADCRGGHENMKPEPDADVFEKILPESDKTRINEVALVGNYAITIVWEDGHQHGIFNWSFLRMLCNCEECKSKR